MIRKEAGISPAFFVWKEISIKIIKPFKIVYLFHIIRLCKN